MIYIIDYGLKNLYEMFHTPGYHPIELRIGDIEFSLRPGENMSIDTLPVFIEQKVKQPNTVRHFQSGDSVMTIEEYREQRSLLASRGSRDDDDNFLFDTWEDKKNYDVFCESWTPVYTVGEFRWEECPFKIITKQYVDPVYKSYITSEIIVRTSEKDEPVKSICIYTPSFEGMCRKIGPALGFVEVENKTFVDNTLGKKFSFNSGIKFSKINNEYIEKYFENRRLFISEKGTYEQCVSAFKRDYSAVEEYLKLVAAKVDGVKIETTTAKDIFDIASEALSRLYKVQPMKASRNEYDGVCKLLNEIKHKITNSL